MKTMRPKFIVVCAVLLSSLADCSVTSIGDDLKTNGTVSSPEATSNGSISFNATLGASSDNAVGSADTLNAIESASSSPNVITASLTTMPANADITPPTITIDAESLNCPISDLSGCTLQRWNISLSFSDRESGLSGVFLRTDRPNFYDKSDINLTYTPFKYGFTSGTIRGQLETTCCVKYIEICAIDAASNLRKVVYKVPYQKPFELIMFFQGFGAFLLVLFVLSIPVVLIRRGTRDAIKANGIEHS